MIRQYQFIEKKKRQFVEFVQHESNLKKKSFFFKTSQFLPVPFSSGARGFAGPLKANKLSITFFFF